MQKVIVAGPNVPDIHVLICDRCGQEWVERRIVPITVDDAEWSTQGSLDICNKCATRG